MKTIFDQSLRPFYMLLLYPNFKDFNTEIIKGSAMNGSHILTYSQQNCY